MKTDRDSAKARRYEIMALDAMAMAKRLRRRMEDYQQRNNRLARENKELTLIAGSGVKEFEKLRKKYVKRSRETV